MIQDARINTLEETVKSLVMAVYMIGAFGLLLVSTIAVRYLLISPAKSFWESENNNGSKTVNEMEDINPFNVLLD